ncbi:sigma-54-dependent transcriptional regulator [Solimicrobium silvestre]|uniref:Response regulator containing CheY-like receiver AAA-type ATPase n=1 Tax=Solimicrobium silvestre TaxID=2099400 RepID=A0A2S9H4R5_9BURK|nr:sigma-54 dependent transcriptional regulator [Solimicrobium silvestre]PRC94957.1 Response regulator containing CheY-like receiver AAA-type ATPase [Solimicrobium silvestre]
MQRKMPYTNPTATILIIDDDADIACAAQLLLRRRFGSIHTLTDPTGLTHLLKSVQPDVVLLDLNFTPGRIDGSEGLALLDMLQNQANPPAVITMTAYADVPLAVAALKRGATDFITKPWDNEHLIATIQAALTRRFAHEKSKQTTFASNHPQVAKSGLIGNSRAMNDLRAMLASVAPTSANVMILGENGVGKELVARAIHDASTRAGNTFLSVDMGALPESTLESELFGHRKGSFTGAQGERAGRFQAARGGTLFLDELGNMPLGAQAKLLTVLERREVTPLGADQPIAIDVRIVSATNLDEVSLYQPQVFRSDLLFRLNTIVIRVPPLRERNEDVPMLLEHYLHHYQQQYQRAARPVSVTTLSRLVNYPWPGNVRELRQACERAIILGNNTEYDFHDFGLPTASTNATTVTSTPADTETMSVDSVRLESLEREAINTALASAQGNISQASKALGISRPALYRKIEKHGI